MPKQHHAELYAAVLEQPLLLDKILSNLSPCDAVCLKLTGGSFVREPRFEDTLHLFLESKREEHEMFCFVLIDEIKQGCSLVDNIHQINRVYDFILFHKHYMEHEDFETFFETIEQKLIRETDSLEYGHYAIYYLFELFGIPVQAYMDDNTGELVEFVQDRHGRRHIV